MSRSHDLRLMEFLNIYKDKIMQKRKNKELEELLETGLHRNVKKNKRIHLELQFQKRNTEEN